MSEVGTERLEHALAEIESRVLDEVWVSTRRSICCGLLTALVALAAVMWWHDIAGEGSAYGYNRVPTAGMLGLTAAAVASALALRLRRFRACCLAAFACGLAGVAGAGTFWWLHTGRPGASLPWLLIADIAVILLAIGWLSVVMTPMERSQPQMREHTETAWPF
ncbi:hypothetical protein MHEL_38160 [Mycolicibacterium helvum]|uniref:Transmembrane protein n=1 Tax=Mycolicibacterium helvum TaxID=1534349 RepID=A0A7I7T9V0_9MYCO|nr:hypothetical protein MHEL_38160 [Mycolicibacterium helvum]